MYFSLRVERKVPKERHAREAPGGLPYGTHHLRAHDSFAHGGAKESDCAEGRGHPIARTDGGAPSALISLEARRETGNPSLLPREQADPASSALRRGCGLPVIREVTAH